MSNFRPIDRDTDFLLPPSVDEWLPESHLARFVVEVIEQLDLSAMTAAIAGSGSASYHPGLLLGLLVYGYATGVFSSRKLERATYDFGGVPLHCRQRSSRPRHHRHLPAALSRGDRGAVRPGSALAREMGLLKLGTVALDGTKIHANASRHSALSYEHASKIEAQLKAEVAELMAMAEAADQADVPDGMSVPEELARREERLAEIAAPRPRSRRGRRSAMSASRPSIRPSWRRARPRQRQTGKKPGGQPPQPPRKGRCRRIRSI